MANKYTFEFDFKGKTEELERSLSKLQTDFKNLQLPNNIGDNLKKKIEQASDALDNFKNISNKKIFNDTDVRKINQGYEKITDLLEDIGLNYQKLKNVKDTQLLSQAELDKFKELKKSFNDVISLQEKYTKAVKDYNDARKDVKNSGYATALKGIKERLDLSPSTKESTVLQKVDRLSAELKGRKKLTPEETDLKNQLRAFDDLYKKQKGLNDQLYKTEEALKKVLGVDSLSKVIPKFEDIEAVKTFRKELQDIPGIDLSSASLDELKKQLDNLPKEKADEVRKKITDLGGSLKDIDPAAKEAEEAIRGFNNEGEHSKEVAGEIENLSSRFKQFFSITSGFYLLRRAVRSAYTAVQELDAVMTETAVVTDFTVGDMWKQLPQYTKVANELGVATKDVYEAATLYYQQGLDQQQVEQLNVATLKLARIASLDAAEATDRMTNALRGFNMELNETNANRIADVYSKLAAITAADVDEISTAMTKTASIASSAGMQFETTAAFLSQIIETTRESAETAGTAMKTVIARFQELKKAPDEIGEVDGEIVDANKVEGALRTVGISLRDASGQFRELDEVFLELSSKWNSLDKNTQRYIATIAAGSRQQSRFIAMMQNYNHTMELVNAANNAAGASQQQYEKTLESLESKLARLKNAWNEFALTLANSDLIKGTVDALNWLLTTVNKLTGDSGLAKLGVLVGTFGGGKALVSKLFGKKGATEGTALSIGKKLGAQLATGIKSGISSTGVSLISALVPKTGDELADEFNRSIVPTVNKGIIPNLQAVIGLRTKNLKLVEGEFLEQEKISAAIAVGKTALLGYVGIAAAIAALLFIIYKTWKDNTPEEKLKRQTEQVKFLDEQVNAVKQSVDDLKASQESLSEKYKDFELLTEGTQAWKDKLAEVNNEVLDLLDKFPGLAGAITRGDNGLLTIDFDSEAYKQFQSQQEQNLRASEINASFGKIDQVNLGAEVDRRSALTATGLDRNVIDRIAKLVAEGSLRLNSNGDIDQESRFDAAQQLGIGVGEFTREYESVIVNNIETLRKFGQALLADELQVKTHEEAIKDNLIGGFEEANQAILDAATDFATIPDKVDENIRQKYTDVSTGEFSIDQLDKDFVNTVYSGRDAQIKGTKIVDSNGQQIGIVPDAETMLRALSRNANIEKYNSDLAKFNDFIKDGGQKLGDFGKIITGETLTLDEFGKISARTSDDLKDSAQVIYNYLNHYFPEIFNDFGVFLDNFISKYREQEATYDYINKARDRYDNRLEGNFDIKILEGIYKNLDEVSVKYGKGAAESILSGINDNLSNLSPQDQALALSELNKVDWSDKAQLLGLTETLKDLGVTSEDTINTIVSQIIELNHATTKLTFEQFTEKINEFASSIENVKEKVEDGIKTFSKSEYESLISAGANASDFVRTGADQYTYGGETVDLLSTINGNLVTLVNDYDKNLRERIFQGERIDNLSASYKKQLETISTGGLSDLGWDENQVQSNLEILGRAIGLNLEGLNPDRMVEAITKVWNDTYGLNGITYRQNQNTYEGQLRSNRELLYSEQNGQGMLNLYSQNGDEKTLKAIQNIRIEENQLQAQLNKTTKAFRDNNIAAAASNEILTSLVIDTDQANKKLRAYAEQYSKVKDALKETNKESAEYQEAVSSLMNSAGNIFDFNFTQDFIDNYKGGIEGLIEDLIAFGEGGEKGEQAYLRMGQAIFFAREESKNLNTDVLKTEEYLTALANADYQIKMTGVADLTPIFEALKRAGWSAEQIAQYLNDINGWHAEFKLEYDVKDVHWVDPTGEENSYSIPVPRIVAVGTELNTDLDFPDITSSGGGGSSKKENNNKWENPYNILYNHIEHVNELLRERNKIEFEYNKLIRDNSDAVKVEAGLYKEVLANLEEQRKEQQYIYNQAKEGYREQLKDIPYDKYLEEIEDKAIKAAGKARIQQLAGYDFEKNQVYIDWSGIADYEQELKAGGLSDDEAKILNALTSVTDYLKDTESNMDAAEDALMEIENTIYDIQQNLREAYIQFEDRVITAIENIRQQQIDNQKQTNEALDSAASDLLNSIRSNIDKMRQDRANENTEEELARKERRLAYLRMDTSGSHNTEIAKLEKELRESQLDYADTLVDQSLQEMQDQNDAAAEQRERQITLMEDQLEWDKENGIIARQASQLIEDSKNLGYVTEDSALYKILYDGEGWASKSKAALDQILQDTNKQFAKAIAALNELLVPANYGDYSAEIDRQIAKYNQATTEEEKAALLATIERLNILRNKKIDDTESEYAKQNSRELIDSILNGTYDPNQWNEKTVTKTERVEYLPTANRPLLNESNATDDRIDEEKDIVQRIMSSGRRIAEKGVESYNDFGKGDYVVTNGGIYQITGGSNGNFTSELVAAITKKQFKELGGDYRYASGGLADFTGPAWLDGTPSKPEIVLNARDSENLIQLRDILRNNQNSGTNIGDSYFDIDINVDEIAGDYDVDRMVDRIKQIIYNDSTRNQVYIPRQLKRKMRRLL